MATISSTIQYNSIPYPTEARFATVSVTSSHGPSKIDWSSRAGGDRIVSVPLSPVYNLLNTASHALAVVPLQGDLDWQEVVVAAGHNDSAEAGTVEVSVSMSHFPPENQQKLTLSMAVGSGESATLHLVLRALD